MMKFDDLMFTFKILVIVGALDALLIFIAGLLCWTQGWKSGFKASTNFDDVYADLLKEYITQTSDIVAQNIVTKVKVLIDKKGFEKND
jgi:hypothetical protein